MAKASVLVLNGPNLNLLGTREPEVYGTLTLRELDALCLAEGAALRLDVVTEQSNHEGQLIDWIHQAPGRHDGLVLNLGAFTHTSVAIMDAVRGVGLPVVEVHLSNIHARETFRHRSYISSVAVGVICGFGALGYRFALRAMAEHLSKG